MTVCVKISDTNVFCFVEHLLRRSLRDLHSDIYIVNSWPIFKVIYIPRKIVQVYLQKPWERTRKPAG